MVIYKELPNTGYQPKKSTLKQHPEPPNKGSNVKAAENKKISEIEAIRRIQFMINEGMLSEKDKQILGMAVTALEDVLINKVNGHKEAV